MKRWIFPLAGMLLTLPAFAANETQPAYRLTKTIPVSGDGGWDILTMDSAAHRLYIARGTHVQVIDVEKGALVGDIPDTPGVHGVAIAPKEKRGFATDGGNNSVTVFDLKTLKTLGTVPVGERPDDIAYDPSGGRIFACDAGSDDLTAIDPKTQKAVGTVPLGGKPEFAVADGRGHLYVNLEDKSEIVQVDSKALKVLNHWSLAPGEGPSGLAIDAKNHRLFATCDNQMMVVMDADTGKVVATPAIGSGPDSGGFDPSLHLAFSSNGEGTLSVIREIDPDHFDAEATVVTQPGARTMALDEKTHAIYLCAAKMDPTPPPAGAQRRFRRFLPGSFVVLKVERTKN